MLQQTCHGRPIVQGETSRNVVVTLRDRLETQNLQAQRRQLAAAKVKYIVISTPRVAPMGSRMTIPERIQSSIGGPDLTVLRVY